MKTALSVVGHYLLGLPIAFGPRNFILSTPHLALSFRWWPGWVLQLRAYHLNRLKTAHLVKVLVQGKHRFYSLEGPEVASALEGLSVLAGGSRDKFVPNTPSRLRVARTCYDHMAGKVGVLLHDRFKALGWLAGSNTNANDNAYDLTPNGTKAFEALGIDIEATRTLRRRFACACLDWSERRPHVGGALGAALLKIALRRKWVLQDLDSRVLDVTSIGRREMLTRFGLHV
jgi:hypothetical protein